MNDTIRKIRRSQYITNYGVGGILDIGNESFVARDISLWRKKPGEVIHLKRLEYRLYKKEFRMPPVDKKSWDKNPAGLPYYRFPQWLFCQSCRKLSRWSPQKEEKGQLPECENRNCRGNKTLVPMRFVLACEDGHLGDVPWGFWAHSDRNNTDEGRCELHDLEFRSVRGKGGGLASLKVLCVTCGSERTLAGITFRNRMESIGIRCLGRQPWQYVQYGSPEGACECSAQVLQRGASNLYYPAIVSALDIPLGYVDSAVSGQEQEIRSHGLFSYLLDKVNNSEGGPVDDLINSLAGDIAEGAGCDIQTVLDLISGKEKELDEEDELPIDEAEVLAEEWPILTNPPEDDDYKAFLAKEVNVEEAAITHGLENLIDKLVLVSRLREVRVLRGFHRIVPAEEERLVPADLGKKYDWLPGMEVFGEGIFMSFREKAIQNWLSDYSAPIKSRLDMMQQKHENDELYYLPKPTPRFVMLHTFAHLLIRQLSFECGYSASSLRERIYSAELEDESGPMAGFLIYTADSDSEGSLGGLVRQGQPDRMIPTMMIALERGLWCSSDPVCKELPGQGMRGLNRAACHSCALLSETSCIAHNALLDRMLVLGSDASGGDYGFFAPLLTQLSNEVSN